MAAGEAFADDAGGGDQVGETLGAAQVRAGCGGEEGGGCWWGGGRRAAGEGGGGLRGAAAASERDAGEEVEWEGSCGGGGWSHGWCGSGGVGCGDVREVGLRVCGEHGVGCISVDQSRVVWV